MSGVRAPRFTLSAGHSNASGASMLGAGRVYSPKEPDTSDAIFNGERWR